MTIYAFPSGHDPKTGRQEQGITLLDYFAAKVIQGLSANPSANWTDKDSEFMASCAYMIAKAMMKAREEQ